MLEIRMKIVRRQCLPLFALHILCFTYLAIGEPFYQRRDHMDQSRYTQIHNENIVKNRNDAEIVLSKYGYLQCQEKRHRGEALKSKNNAEFFPSKQVSRVIKDSNDTAFGGFNVWGDAVGEGGVEACDENEVAKAILDYQRTYNLRPTGKLDKETKQLLSSSRCGNKDNDEGNRIIMDTSLKAVASSGKLANDVYRSAFSKDSSKKKKQNALSDMDTAHQLWKRASDKIRTDNPSNFLQILRSAVKMTSRDVSKSRHLLHLQNYINRLDNKDERLLEPWTEEQHTLAKRSVRVVGSRLRSANLHNAMVDTSITTGISRSQGIVSFKEAVVRWRLLNTGYSTRIPVVDQRATVDLAFRMWSEVIPVNFVEDTESDISQVDIEVAFGKGAHQNCYRDFDGNGGDIAHSDDAGNIHFDDDENFKSIRSHTTDGIYLLRVIVHEIGHVLGLDHINKSQSIMYAIYHGSKLSPEFELSRNDRMDVQKIYGVCKGRFNVVFDWVRKRPDNQFIYNTYFFRSTQYWMYENHAHRTRYGDPLYIAREWEGVPSDVDGYAHVWYFNGSSIVNDALFFKGEQYYRYDSETDRVFDGWPHFISDDFSPKPGYDEGIPDNLDTVFMDMRDRNIYFFKGDTVYVFDPKESEVVRGCCLRKRLILDEFPPSSPAEKPLPSHLNNVYYSYEDKMQYFIHGDDLWLNRAFDPRQHHIVNSIEYVGKWYDRWFDICDVEAHIRH